MTQFRGEVKDDLLQVSQASMLCAQHAFISGDQALLESNQAYHVGFLLPIIKGGKLTTV